MTAGTLAKGLFLSAFAILCGCAERGAPVPDDWPRATPAGRFPAESRPVETPKPSPPPRSSTPTIYERPEVPAAVLDLDVQNRIGPLPPQSLNVGTCGLFLYARIPRARLVFFSLGYDGDAEMVIGGKKVSLPRKRAEGDSLFGHFERQRFADDTGIDVLANIEMERQKGVLQGAVVRRGNIRVRDRDGWSFVVPVAGLVACQTEESARATKAKDARRSPRRQPPSDCPIGWSCDR